MQYPGRGNRKGEKFAKSAREIASSLRDALVGYCGDDGVRFVVVAHSVGTWVAYELLRLLRSDPSVPRRLRSPEHVYLSSFPPPTIPLEERPWNVNEDLDEEEFKFECRRWDINEVVFGGIWGMYHPLLRADFALFDKYEHEGEEKPKNKPDWDLTVFSAKNDRMITEAMCKEWKGQTSGKFELVRNEGHHLFPLEKEQKPIWLGEIAKSLDGVLELIELKEEYCM